MRMFDKESVKKERKKAKKVPVLGDVTKYKEFLKEQEKQEELMKYSRSRIFRRGHNQVVCMESEYFWFGDRESDTPQKHYVGVGTPWSADTQ